MFCLFETRSFESWNVFCCILTYKHDTFMHTYTYKAIRTDLQVCSVGVQRGQLAIYLFLLLKLIKDLMALTSDEKLFHKFAHYINCKSVYENPACFNVGSLRRSNQPNLKTIAVLSQKLLQGWYKEIFLKQYFGWDYSITLWGMSP